MPRLPLDTCVSDSQGGMGYMIQRVACEMFRREKIDVVAAAEARGFIFAAPVAMELNASLVFDMVYNPLETPLLKLARELGIPAISGMEMFVQQGARQFEIWTGKPAPEAEMLRVVELELRRRG